MAGKRILRTGGERLRFVDDTAPGFTRRRSGKVWAYFDPEGKRVSDRDTIDRLNGIALPPAYTQAWYCPEPDGHLLATGIDARGRKQYRYHPGYRAHRESAKFDGCAAFGRLLPKLRARVAEDLARSGLGRERAIASVVRLLDCSAIRVGSEEYARDNKTFGATTLRMRHARVTGGKVRLAFLAKSGKRCELTLSDKALVRFVRRMQDLPGQHLFQYLDADGTAQPVGSAEVNAYLRAATGSDFTAKHFRTWHASALAFELLAEAEGQVSLKELLGAVSERLGNTPAVARKSYVHPAVLALVERQEKWRAKLKLPRDAKWLSRHERGLVAFLEKA